MRTPQWRKSHLGPQTTLYLSSASYKMLSTTPFKSQQHSLILNRRRFFIPTLPYAMVSLSDVESSKSRIATALPPRLLAVFVGATCGIGEYTLKQFARRVREPRVYFVGRSQEAYKRKIQGLECSWRINLH